MVSLYITSSLVDTSHLILSNVSTPFYYLDRPRFHPGLSDKSLALLAPLLTYWSIFLLHQVFLVAHAPRRRPRSYKWRLTAEIQFVQTLFGWVWLTRYGRKEGPPNDLVGDIRAVGNIFGVVLPWLMGRANAQHFLDQNGEELIQFAYWWALPIARQFFASFTIDAWQCLLRSLHVDRYLYPDVHAFIFDTLGVCFAYSLSGITNREAAIFIILSTLQTFSKPSKSPLPKSSLHPSIPLDGEFRQNAPVWPFIACLARLH
ncbi:hypothetical protein K439DRAFT_1002335 [Ramaria rubella]|nr:hypothetical protein K439DRAFT_1002335 [Ramaria rubella]